MQLVILGMHRSGTSTVARLLNLFGAYLGPNDAMIPPNSQNPKGFWERRDVRACCDRALFSLGVDWWRPSKLDLGALSTEQRELAAAEIRGIVTDLDAHRPWAVKEPRLCLLLPLWRPLLSSPVVVHVVRSPLEIARSLATRNQLPLPLGLALWELYRVRALQASAGLPSTTVDYNELTRAPVEQTHALFRALEALGVSGLVLPSDETIVDFVEPALHRERELPGERDGLFTQRQERLSAWTPSDPVPEVSPALLASLRSLEERESLIVELRATRQSDRNTIAAQRDALRRSEAEAKVARRSVRELEAARTGLLDQNAALRAHARSLKKEARESACAKDKALSKADARAKRAEERHAAAAKQLARVERRLERALKKQRRPAVVAIDWIEASVAGALKRVRRRRKNAHTPVVVSAPAPEASRAPSGAKRSEVSRRTGGSGGVSPPEASRIEEPPEPPSEERSQYHATIEPILADEPNTLFRENHALSARAIAECLAEPLGNRPLVSVIMPAYNREAIVGDAVRSVLAQTYPDLELIVCDDGSTDGTVGVLRAFDDPRIRILTAEHGGAARARNLALATAKGAFFSYLDSDNIWHPSLLDVMVRQMLAHPGRLLAYAKYVDAWVEENRTRLKKAAALPFDYETLSDRNFIDLNTVIHRRSLFDYFGGFDEELVRQQDWDLLLKYTHVSDPVYVDMFLAVYRRNSGWNQISTIERENQAPQERILDKVTAYYASGVPIATRTKPPAVSVISWDICRNHFSKAYSVAEILARRHDVQLLGFRFFEEGLFGPFRDERPAFETTYFDGGKLPELHRTFANAVRAIRGDVIYAVKPRLTSLGAALMANYHYGTPLILEHNDLESVVTSPGVGDSVASLTPADVDLHDPDLANPYGQTWSRLMQYFAQKVPVTTTHNRNLDRFFGGRSFFIRNPKDETFYDPARYDRTVVRAELGFGDDDRVILFGGMLRRHKGIRELVNLLSRLGPSYKLLFVASRENDEQRTLERSVDDSRVCFLGPHNRNEMARINYASDLVILWLDPEVPAAHYQMPYKLTDALAMHVPVIANDISDLGELGKMGCLRPCAYGDYAGLQRTIEALFENEAARLAMVAAARRLYLRQFSYQALERLLPLVLDCALEQRGTLAASEEFADFFARVYAARGERAALEV